MSTTISALDSSFTSLINSLMTIERQPLTALTTKKDTITVQQAVYTDLNGLLTDFQGAVNALQSTNPSYTFSSQYKASVASLSSGSTVLTASATSSAVPAQYQVSVTDLAREHRVRSKQVAYTDQALNLTDSFYLGGDGTAKITSFSGLGSTLTAASTGDVESGQKELGNGTYAIETRQYNDAWQFRLVDKNGKAVSIRKADGAYSSDWQAFPAGAPVDYDTGRGIKLSFGSGAEIGTAQVTYQGKGTKIAVTADDSLTEIAYNINNAAYAQDEEVLATILDKQLILSRKVSGAGNNLIVTDAAGDDDILSALEIWNGTSFLHELQSAQNAAFTVNGISVSRSRNTSLTDVIQGVTLNLAADAEDKTATLDVKYDSTSEKNVLNNFISKFNGLQSYLSAKIATVKQDDGTYKRGALAGDSMFQSLRMDLLQNTTAATLNSGVFSRLSDIGISMSDSFSLSISDSAKLEKALAENKKDVTALIDSVMSKLQSKLSRFTGGSGYVTTASNALSKQLDLTNDQITAMNSTLSTKEESLRSRYAEIQAQLELMSYQQQQLSAIYSTISQYS